MGEAYRITPQSAPAAAIRDAYDRLMDVQHELVLAGEVADKPHLCYQHILRASTYATKTINNLVATQVIKYEQLTMNLRQP